MSYQVIARKWRPQSFADLKGQSSTRRTLINAIATDRLHHALLFTGPRGTGKTSTARIVAKILRCTDLQKDQTPCDKCTDCIEISEGRSLDVLEIDGASNNGVDSIRELRDQVSFNPSSGNTKVYIIDEVHMLSTSAFNALLKTLEEPPEGVYFIMATTEAHKLPKTILSRCQRYDFKPVPFVEVINLLRTICEAEKVTYEDDALFLIAQMGEGSVRDSLSFLDQCITFSEGELTKKSVVENLGVTDIGHFKDVLEILIARDSSRLVSELENIKDFNIEPQTYLEELVIHVKNLILFKVDGANLQKVEDYSEAEKSIYSKLAPTSNLEDLYILFDICFKGTVQLVRSFNPSVLLEVTLLKAGTSPFYNDLLGGGGGAPYKAPSSGVGAPSESVDPAGGGAANLKGGLAQGLEKQLTGEKPYKSSHQVSSHKVSQEAKSSQTTEPTKPIPQYKESAPSYKTSQASTDASPYKVAQEKAQTSGQSSNKSTAKPNGWSGFVSMLKAESPVVGAKLELCQYSYDQDQKVLSLAVSAKNSFLREQVSSQDFLNLVQKHLVEVWGKGVTVKYGLNDSKEDFKPSVQAVEEKTSNDKLEQIKKNVENHAVIKSMQEKYKIEIKSIKENKE